MSKRAEKRRESREYKRKIKDAKIASSQGNMILDHETIDKYIKNVKVGDIPYIISPDKEKILCLCQDVHEIKKDKKGRKTLSCPILDIKVTSRSRAILMQKFIKKVVELIEFEESTEEIEL